MSTCYASPLVSSPLSMYCIRVLFSFHVHVGEGELTLTHCTCSIICKLHVSHIKRRGRCYILHSNTSTSAGVSESRPVDASSGTVLFVVVLVD